MKRFLFAMIAVIGTQLCMAQSEAPVIATYASPTNTATEYVWTSSFRSVSLGGVLISTTHSVAETGTLYVVNSSGSTVITSQVATAAMASPATQVWTYEPGQIVVEKGGKVIIGMQTTNEVAVILNNFTLE